MMYMDSTFQQVILIVIMVIAFVPAITVHEYAHGWMANKLGDPTAKNMGRLSLNPIRHIDPFGTVLLPLLLIGSSVLTGGLGVIFGYAKPVPYNPNNFKDIRKGEVLTGLAGPVSNLIMSLIGAAIAWLATYLFYVQPQVALYVWYFGAYFCQINLFLAFFNIIPLPPLDGSSIIAPFLSDNALRTYYKVQQYSMFILLVVIIFLPRIIGVDILGIYLDATAGNIANLLLP